MEKINRHTWHVSNGQLSFFVRFSWLLSVDVLWNFFVCCVWWPQWCWREWGWSRTPEPNKANITRDCVGETFFNFKCVWKYFKPTSRNFHLTTTTSKYLFILIVHILINDAIEPKGKNPKNLWFLTKTHCSFLFFIF